jgi:hypothetical protein
MAKMYKFIRDPAIAPKILTGEVKFTPIAELNDPSELNPSLNADAIKASLQKLRERGYSEEEFKDLQRQAALLDLLAPQPIARAQMLTTREDANRRIKESIYDQTSFMEDKMMETTNAISQNVGIFCLSTRYDSLPMWAHYAANASGFVVEFVNLKKHFDWDEKGVLNTPKKVNYDREIASMTFDPRSHESLFFSKFKDWSYERELRVIRPLNDCYRKETESGTIYIEKIPIENINRIILGWKMKGSEAEFIRNSAQTMNSKAQVVRAKFLNGKVHVCDTSYGHLEK